MNRSFNNFRGWWWLPRKNVNRELNQRKELAGGSWLDQKKRGVTRSYDEAQERTPVSYRAQETK
jgi:hypothetical protein